MRSILLLGALVSAPALAGVPTELSHQGRLFDSTGIPLDGDHDVSFRLYDTETGGTAGHQVDLGAVSFTDGYYSVLLDGVDDTIASGSKLWMSIEIDSSGVEIDRVPVVSVPYAVRATAADTAVDLSGGVVDATEIRVNGTTVIDSSGQISGASLPGGDGDRLVELGCSNAGDIALYDGLDWTCAPVDQPHTHDASHVDSGVLDINRLPIGAGSSEVAAGDHLHALSQLTGQVAVGQLPVGTGSGQVAAGDHSHGSVDFADLTGSAAFGQLPTGTGASQVAAGDHSHGSVDFADLTGNAAFGQLPTGTGASQVAVGNHGHDIGDISGTIDADSVGGLTVSNLVSKTTATGTVSAGGSLDVAHNQGSFDVGVSVWQDQGGIWTLADLTGGTSGGAPTSGLVGHWSFDEGAGNTAVDQSGNGNNASRQNGALWGVGQLGASADLNGNNGYFQAADSASLDVSGNAITMAAWVFREASSGGAQRMIINKESSYEMALEQGQGVFEWALQTNTTGWYWVQTGFTPPLNTWVHLAVTYDGTTARAYANGVEVHNQGYTGTVTPSNRPLRVGARDNPGSFFAIGQIDEAMVYNRALTVAELALLGAASAPTSLAVTQSDNNTVTVSNNGGSDVDVRVIVHH